MAIFKKYLGGVPLICTIFAFLCFVGQKTATLNTLTSPKIPIIMYHAVLNDDERLDKYVITPKKLEEDFTYIKEKGYTPISSSDLINFSKSGVSLPEKPIIITFDDGYYNNYTYAFPLLKKYAFKAIFSAVGKYQEQYSEENAVLNNNYSHIPFDKLKEMYLSGYVEVANHSYNMHDLKKRKGILRKRGENEAEYKETLTADVLNAENLLKSKCNISPVAFTYPFGAVNKEAKSVIEGLGYLVTYGCEEGINYITNDISSLHNLKRFNRDGRMSTEEFFKQIN